MFEALRSVNETLQKTENIKASAYAQISVIQANASSLATQILQKGAGQVAKQNIDYTTKALGYVQKQLKFTEQQNSLLDYYYYQRIAALKEDTSNKLLVGKMNATVIPN